MKKLSFEFGFIAIAITFIMVTTPHFSIAGGPFILTSSDIACSGDLQIDQQCNFPSYGSATTYSDSINSNSGTTSVFIKNFSSAATSDNSIEVERFLLTTPNAASTVSTFTSVESVGSSASSDSNFYNNNAGSSLSGNWVFSHSETNVNITSESQLYHGTLAQGQGTASAIASSQQIDGSGEVSTGSTGVSSLSNTSTVSSWPRGGNNSYFLGQSFLINGQTP